MGKSLYDLLDLEENAAPSQIQSAFVRLKHQYEQQHPEADPKHVSPIQFQAISEAHAVLSEPKRRELYDQKLITARQQSYAVAEPTSTGFPVIKLALLALAAVIAWMAYMRYENNQAEKARALHRLELEQAALKLKQDELRLEEEKAAFEREQTRIAQQEAKQRELELMQSRRDAQRYAADQSRAQEAEQRQLARLDAERARRERATSTGPTYIRR